MAARFNCGGAGISVCKCFGKLGFDWWTDENYSHGLLVPFVIGFIVWTEFDELKKAAGKPQILLGGALVLSALLMFLGGTLGAELFAQRISLVVMIAGIVVYFRRRFNYVSRRAAPVFQSECGE